MSTSLQKTPQETFDRARFNDDYIEDSDALVRQQLDLRPAHYLQDTCTPGTHPDRRPCPSWCYIGQSTEYDHEVDYTRPLTATHIMNATPHVVASQYQGDPDRGQKMVVSTAAIEPRLEQIGQDDPLVLVAFRRYHGRQQQYDHELLRLSLTDARELARVLNHLVDIAS